VRQLGLSHRSQSAAPPHKQLLRVPFLSGGIRMRYVIGCIGFCVLGMFVTATVFVHEGGM